MADGNMKLKIDGELTLDTTKAEKNIQALGEIKQSVDLEPEIKINPGNLKKQLEEELQGHNLSKKSWTTLNTYVDNLEKSLNGLKGTDNILNEITAQLDFFDGKVDEAYGNYLKYKKMSDEASTFKRGRSELDWKTMEKSNGSMIEALGMQQTLQKVFLKNLVALEEQASKLLPKDQTANTDELEKQSFVLANINDKYEAQLAELDKIAYKNQKLSTIIKDSLPQGKTVDEKFLAGNNAIMQEVSQFEKLKDTTSETAQEYLKNIKEMLNAKIKFLQNEGMKDSLEYEKLATALQIVTDKYNNVTAAIEKKNQADEQSSGVFEGTDIPEYIANMEELGQKIGGVSDKTNNLKKIIGGIGGLFGKAFTLSKDAIVAPSLLGRIANMFRKTGDEAIKSHKKSNNFFRELMQFGLAAVGVRSLYMLFRRLINTVKEGVTNIAQFTGTSSGVGQSIQNITNSLSYMKNAWGAAFAPIVQIVEPLLIRLINIIAAVANAIAQLFAVLTGKGTFIKAKKQIGGVNKALGGTSKAADKARGSLAAFDDLDVLNPPEDSGSGGGGGSGLDVSGMFEEVELDSWASKFADILDYIKKLWEQFKAGLEEGFNTANLDGLIEAATKLKNSILDIFTSPEVLAAADNWAMTWAYSLGQLTGSIASLGVTIATLFVGGIANYLESSSEFIKNRIVELFDVNAKIGEMIGNLSVALADIFSVFSSEESQMAMGNFIGIFANAFLAIGELWAMFRANVLDVIITPIVNNVNNIKIALTGFISFLNTILASIKQFVDEIWTKVIELYQVYLAPFFEELSQDISDLVGQFLDFWNNNVQPILDQWGQTFQELVANELTPLTAKVTALIGQIINIIRKIWHEWIKPLISWIIANVLPVVLPIVNGVVNALLKFGGVVGTVIGTALSVISGLLTFVTKVFKGDWKGAWEAVESIVSSVWKGIKKTINGILGGVQSMANGVIDGINTMIRALNGVGFDIPSWVPAIGGKSFRLNLRQLGHVYIPKLAQGAVIPPNSEFLALLGDQKRGTNIEAPLDTIVDAFREVVGNMEVHNQGNAVMEVDGQVFARLVTPYVVSELNRRGYNVTVLEG